MILPLLLTVLIAVTSDEAKVRMEIEALYRQVEAAYARRDAKAIAAFMLPTAKLKGTDGKVRTRAQWLKDTAKEIGKTRSVQVKYAIQKLVARGKQVMVDRTMQIHVVVNDPSGNHVPLEAVTFTRDTLTKTSAGWRLSYSDAKSISGPRPVSPAVEEKQGARPKKL